MRFIKKLKNKQGMAIENAILFMLVIFSLCALLTTLTALGRFQIQIDKTKLVYDVELDEIGEDYLYSVKTGEEFNFSYENYGYSVSENALTVWNISDESKTAVLYVEAKLTDGGLEILAWRYSSP